MAPPGRPPVFFMSATVPLDLISVFIPQRKLPHALAGAFACLSHANGQLLVVAHHTDGVVTEGDDAGAREGGEVDDGCRLEALGVGEGVGEDESTLGVPC